MACKGKIITIGLGKSGHVAKKASATFSSTGSPSIFLHAAEALHGDMGLVEKSDVVIFYSNSGETKELLLLLPLFLFIFENCFSRADDWGMSIITAVRFPLLSC